MNHQKTSPMGRAKVYLICSATAILLYASWPTLYGTYTSQLHYVEALMEPSSVTILQGRYPDGPLPSSKSPPLAGKNTTASSSTEPPTSCCVECDIAKLRVGEDHRVHGCPQLDYGLPSTVLGQLFREGGSKPVWIANLGDSMLRKSFCALPGTIMGSEWHVDRRSFNRSWYHVEQVFCCANRFDTSTCMYGRQRFEFQESVHEFVQKFLASSTGGFCESFSFKSIVSVIQPLLKTYMDCALPPMLVVMNPGLHHLTRKMSSDKHGAVVQGLFENIVVWQRERSRAAPTAVQTRFLFFFTTMVNDTITQLRTTPLYNRDVLAYNEATGNVARRMSRNLSEANVHIIDAHRLSSLGDVPPSDDGVHYVGSYGDIVHSIKFNFLLHAEFCEFCSSRFS